MANNKLQGFEAYKRIQFENEGVQNLIKQVDHFKNTYDLLDLDNDYFNGLKFVDQQTSSEIRNNIFKLAQLLDDASNDLYREGHKAVKQIKHENN